MRTTAWLLTFHAWMDPPARKKEVIVWFHLCVWRENLKKMAVHRLRTTKKGWDKTVYIHLCNALWIAIEVRLKPTSTKWYWISLNLDDRFASSVRVVVFSSLKKSCESATKYRAYSSKIIRRIGRFKTSLTQTGNGFKWILWINFSQRGYSIGFFFLVPTNA